MEQQMNKPELNCKYTEPIDILLWSFCIDHNGAFIEDHPTDRIRFFYGENKKTQSVVNRQDVVYFSDKYKVSYEDIKKSLSYDGRRHNWISSVKHPTIKEDFYDFIKSHELTHI